MDLKIGHCAFLKEEGLKQQRIQKYPSLKKMQISFILVASFAPLLYLPKCLCFEYEYKNLPKEYRQDSTTLLMKQ